MRAGPVLGVLLIGVLWGLNWPAVKFMLTEVPPLTIRAAAFPLAGLLLAVIVCVRGQRLRPCRDEWGAIAVTGLLLVFGFNVLTVLGQMLTETSRAAIIAYTMPVFTALFAAFLLGERLGTRSVIALALGMGGLGILASENLDGLLAEPLGPILMLLAALSWALGNVALKARQWSLSPAALTAWFFAVASVVCWPLALIFEPLPALPGAPVLWTFVYHVLGPMVICYAVWAVVLEKLPATVAAISILTAPVVGVASSVMLLGDPPTWQKAVALALVIASIAMTLRPAPRSDTG